MLSVIHYCVSHVSNFDSIINNVVWSLNMFLVRNHVLFRKAISAIIILSSSFAGLSNKWKPVVIWTFIHILLWEICIISWCSIVFCFLLLWWMAFLKELLPKRMSWLITIQEMVIFPSFVSLGCYFLVLLVFMKFIFVIHKWQSEIYQLYLIRSFVFKPHQPLWDQMIFSLFYVFCFGLWIC